MSKTWLFLLCLFVVSGTASLAQIYRWTDASGQLHFTNDPDTIPPDRLPYSRQLPPSPTPTNPPTTAAPPGSPSFPPPPDISQSLGPEEALRLQQQALALEHDIAATLQERQQLVEEINAVRPLRLNPLSGALERRQIDSKGRALAAVEKRLDALYAELRQVQATLQAHVQDQSPGAVATRPQEEVILDNQGHDRTYWRRRLDPLRARLQEHQARRQALLQDLGADSRQRRGFGRRGHEVLQHNRALEQTAQDIRDTEAALEALQQEATQAGVPAEWLQ